MTTRSSIVIGATAGAATTGISASLSVADSLGRTPAGLFLETQAWSSMLRIGGLPIEFIGFAWFAAVLAVYSSELRRAQTMVIFVSMTAAAVAGFGLWYLASRSAWCWPFYGIVGSAGLILTATSIDGAAWPSSLRSALIADIRLLRAAPWARAAITAFVGAMVLIGSTIHVLAGSVSAEEAFERDLRRWYLTQDPGFEPDLAPLLVGEDRVRVVVFTDYLSPSARHVVSQRAAQVAGFRTRGLPVDLVTLDWPGDACGESAVPEGRSVSCEAAFAMKLVSANLGDGVASRMAAWLYSRAPVLTVELIHHHLEELGVISEFHRRYTSLSAAVATDVRLGRRLGVTSAPAYFVNGVRIPEGKGMLTRILGIESERRSQIRAQAR